MKLADHGISNAAFRVDKDQHVVETRNDRSSFDSLAVKKPGHPSFHKVMARAGILATANLQYYY